jgi:hypothetical protein
VSEEEPLPPPVTLGPFAIEYFGERRGLMTLHVRVGRHTLELFATPAKGISARLAAQLDGRQLVKRKKRRRQFRVWARDIRVARWIIAAATESDDGRPRWSCRAIAFNLRRHSGTHANMSSEAVRRMIWRHSPALAKRRADYWKTRPAERPALARKARSKEDAERRAAVKAAQVDELRRAGLL